MPVTITLTDDQALEIMAQIGGMLKKGPKQNTPRAPNQTIIEAIQALSSGTVFATSQIAAELGYSTTQVSVMLTKILRKTKVVEMVHRGTWRRL